MPKHPIPFILIVIQTLMGPATNACVNPIEVLGDEDHTADILCGGGVSPSNTPSWMHNNVMITIDGVKYTTASNGARLQVHSVIGSDEGSYSCRYEDNQGQLQTDDSSCLYVLGRAVFTTCGNTQSCREDVDLVVGIPIFFDTRISYLGAGNLNRRQMTLELFLRKGDRDGTIYAVCSNRTGNCEDRTSQDHLTFAVGSYLFDVNITLSRTTLEDVGEYTSVVDLRDYTSGGTAQITKTFVAILKCTILRNPSNGQVTVNADGNRANYSCDEPYTLIGNTLRRCTDNGSWSGIEPACLLPTSTLPLSTTDRTETTVTGLPTPTLLSSTTDMSETTATGAPTLSTTVLSETPTSGPMAVTAFPVAAVVVAALLVASLAGIVILTVFIVVAFLMRHHIYVIQSDGLRLMSQLSNTSEQQPGNGGVIGTNLEQTNLEQSHEGNDDKKFAFDGPTDFV